MELLGISALAWKIREISQSVGVSLEQFENDLYADRLNWSNPSLSSIKKEVQRQVAEVIVFGKRLDPGGFSSKIPQGELPVFIGGGGANYQCYKTAIFMTHSDFNHTNAGIPPYNLVKVLKPSDLNLSDLPDDSYYRFCVAYGLTLEGELAEFRLPSEMNEEMYAARLGKVKKIQTCRFCNNPPIPGEDVCLSCSL